MTPGTEGRIERPHGFAQGRPVRVLHVDLDGYEASILDAFRIAQAGAVPAREPPRLVLGDSHVVDVLTRSLRVVGRRHQEYAVNTTADRTPADIESMSHPNTKKIAQPAPSCPA